MMDLVPSRLVEKSELRNQGKLPSLGSMEEKGFGKPSIFEDFSGFSRWLDFVWLVGMHFLDG
jgi:hypothetical protein